MGTYPLMDTIGGRKAKRNNLALIPHQLQHTYLLTLFGNQIRIPIDSRKCPLCNKE